MSLTAARTIYALATGGHARSAIAIVRISGLSHVDGSYLESCWPYNNAGEHALYTLERVTLRGRQRQPFASRHLYYTHVLHPSTNELLDQALCVYMPKPHTATGVHASRRGMNEERASCAQVRT